MEEPPYLRCYCRTFAYVRTALELEFRNKHTSTSSHSPFLHSLYKNVRWITLKSRLPEWRSRWPSRRLLQTPRLLVGEEQQMLTIQSRPDWVCCGDVGRGWGRWQGVGRAANSRGPASTPSICDVATVRCSLQLTSAISQRAESELYATLGVSRADREQLSTMGLLVQSRKYCR